eukprot:833734-Rhodomonas_salina.2
MQSSTCYPGGTEARINPSWKRNPTPTSARLLHALHARHAETLIVWVKAHAGDPGNEQADAAAKARAALSERDLECNVDTTPITYCSNSPTRFPCATT